MKTSMQIVAVTAACLLIGACSSTPKTETPVSTTEMSQEVKRLQEDMAQMEKAHADILAPNAWSRASDATKRAADKMSRSGESRDVMRDVTEARIALKEVNARTTDAQSSLPDLLEVRRMALEARAPEFASREWDAAENSFRTFTRSYEEVRTPITSKRRADLRGFYQAARVAAMQNMYLGDARSSIHEADLQRGREIVPHFYNQAVKSLKNAEGFIAANSTDANGIKMMSTRAITDANRLLRMTKEAVSVKRSTPEQAALALVRLRGRADKLDGALDREAFEEKFQNADGVFSDEEADVFKQGDRLVIRLKGIEFPFASSTLPSSSYPLLSKAGGVIKSFGDAKVVIEGHADSIGGSKVNQEISRARAESVRSYLASNSDVKSENVDIAAAGYDKPVASNKSSQGRAENRRVDLIIIPENKPETQVGQQNQR